MAVERGSPRGIQEAREPHGSHWRALVGQGSGKEGAHGSLPVTTGGGLAHVQNIGPGGRVMSSRSGKKAWELHLLQLYRSCELCPRSCRVDRLAGNRGRCGQGASLRIAHIGRHMGEEPPITGTRGSGTVFFTGCSLGCSFCQNYQISRFGMGSVLSVQETARRISDLWRSAGVHNVNLVTPDHFFPHTVLLVQELRESGLRIPVIYNLSGYQRVETLRLIEQCADIYLPDFKFGDPSLASVLSKASDYPRLALEAVAEMVNQKGFLDGEDEVPWGPDSQAQAGLATRGVLVRHLVLPGHVRNSIEVLNLLFLEFGKDLPLSLMSQYVPVGSQPMRDLERVVSPGEFRQVLEHALELGFQRIFYQPPRDLSADPLERPFLPDFTRQNPFRGNDTSQEGLASGRRHPRGDPRQAVSLDSQGT